jgi:hypothetical protein
MPNRRRSSLVLVLALVQGLGGCISLPRGEAPAVLARVAPPGFDQVRLRSDDPELLAIVQRDVVRVRGASDQPLSVLALSGGAAEGAFGAGVLVGWSHSGQRPEFQVVTGVSAGALIAPFAFLGQGWDDRLEDAFAGRRAARLTSPDSLGAPFGPSLLSGRALERLVDSYVDDALLAAVAREHAKGRRLLVATTDIDRQEAVVWDLGAIAAHGGPEAKRLFRDVLVASASIPGVFPPKLIEVRSAGKVYTEMHVDGGVATPFFSVPPGALFWTAPSGLLERARLYVIVNGRIDPVTQTTQVNTGAVLGRSFETVELLAFRTTLKATAAFCARNQIALETAALPRSAESDGPFAFGRASRRKLFDQGERLGRSGDAWTAWKAIPRAAP